jgi:hypothetical protein
VATQPFQDRFPELVGPSAAVGIQAAVTDTSAAGFHFIWSASTAEPRVPTWPPKWCYDERVVLEGDLVVRGEVAVSTESVHLKEIRGTPEASGSSPPRPTTCYSRVFPETDDRRAPSNESTSSTDR